MVYSSDVSTSTHRKPFSCFPSPELHIVRGLSKDDRSRPSHPQSVRGTSTHSVSVVVTSSSFTGKLWRSASQRGPHSPVPPVRDLGVFVVGPSDWGPRRSGTTSLWFPGVLSDTSGSVPHPTDPRHRSKYVLSPSSRGCRPRRNETVGVTSLGQIEVVLPNVTGRNSRG